MSLELLKLKRFETEGEISCHVSVCADNLLAQFTLSLSSGLMSLQILPHSVSFFFCRIGRE